MRSNLIQLKRVRADGFCRVSQAGEPRGSAVAAATDSDGKSRVLGERTI